MVNACVVNAYVVNAFAEHAARSMFAGGGNTVPKEVQIRTTGPPSQFSTRRWTVILHKPEARHKGQGYGT